MNTPIIEQLSKRHRRSDFDCGKVFLNNYLINIASQHEKRDIGRTYIAVDGEDPQVMGYYTLAASHVEATHWPEHLKLPPHMPVPTILLGRLAVDKRFHGRRLGEYLLYHAMWTAEQIGRSLGAVALEVDAIDDAAAAFYLRYGLAPLEDNSRHLFVGMVSIRKLGLDFTRMTR